MSADGVARGLAAKALGLATPSAVYTDADLYFDAVTNIGWAAGAQVAPASLFTDTHAEAVVVQKADGSFTSVAANGAVYQAGLGFATSPRLAELATNPLDISAMFTTRSGTGTASGDQAGPDGTAGTGWTLTDTDATTASSWQKNFTAVTDTLNRIGSVFIKKTTGATTVFPAVAVGYAGGTGITSTLVLDPATGESVHSPGANWIVEDAGAYWRVTGVCQNNGTANTIFFVVLRPAYADSLTTTQKATVTGSNVYAWANVRQADWISAPILSTTTAGGNRVEKAWTAMGEMPVSGYITANIRDTGVNSPTLLAFDDGTANNVFAIQCVSGRAVLSLIAGGVSQAAVDIGPWRVGRQTIAFAVGPNYVVGQFVRGQAATADTTATFPYMTNLSLGGRSGVTTGRINATIEKLYINLGPATAAGFAAAYAKAVAAHGAVPLFWDNFDRADGALGVSASGDEWTQVPSTVSAQIVVATIASKAMLAADSGQTTTASYNVVPLQKTMTSMKAMSSFGAGTVGGAVALIATPYYKTSNAPQFITDKSIHIVFADDHIDVAFWLNGVYSVAKTIKYPTAFAHDGTVYEFGYVISGSTITIFAPWMPPLTVTDARLATYDGQILVFEPFWTGSAQSRPSIQYVEAA